VGVIGHYNFCLVFIKTFSLLPPPMMVVNGARPQRLRFISLLAFVLT
jgi:hypothetical protein